jgi:nicotinamide-nucleotide amidase
LKTSLIAIGSELLRPGSRETHSEWLLPRLQSMGLEIVSRQVVGDDTSAIAAAFAHARSVGSLVLVTGGIGPTRDDRTRQALARLLGVPLRRDRRAEGAIRRWCRRYRIRFTRAQRSQAWFPAGTRPLANPVGSAPGIWLADARGWVIVLPGVFREMAAMLRGLAPRLRRIAGTPPALATLRTAGVGESRIDARIRSVARRYAEVEVTTLASPGEVTIQLWARGRLAARRVAACCGEMARVLGADLVSTDGAALEEVVLDGLRRRRWRLATAESCTAGLLSARLTKVPGSSRVFVGGAVCYSDAAKRRFLEVPPEILRRDGAVSAATARAMARGSTLLFAAPVGVAITGIAGPGGGSTDKPVGTVHVAVAFPGGVRQRRWILPGDREKVRTHAAALALDQLRRALSRPRRGGGA